MRLAWLVFAASLSFIPKSVGASVRPLTGAQWIYGAMEDVFSDFKEHLGGFSYEIRLQNIVCYSSNVLINGETKVQSSCVVTGKDGKVINRDSTKDLFLALLNGESPIDRKSEPGTTYIRAHELVCTVIDPRPSSPDDEHKPEYSCDLTE